MDIESSELICNGNVGIEGNRAEDLGGGLAAYSGSTVSFYVLKANNALRG